MIKHSLKQLMITTAMLSTITALGFADVDNAQMRNLENRVTTLEQRKGAGGVINPSARPEIKKGADLFVTADLLIWEAHEDGLPLFIENNGSISDLSDAKVKGFDWNWNAGCRVGIGYNTPHDGWDVSATWLHFNTDANKTDRAHDTEALFPTLTHPAEPNNGPTNVGAGPFQKVKAHWGMNLNQIDLELGREYYVSKWLTMRPHLGLRTAWVHQTMTVNYNRLASDLGVFQSGIDDHLDLDSDFWGLGLAAGLDTQWGLGGGWSLYGNVGFAFLYGFQNADRDDTISLNTKFKWADIDYSYRITRAIGDLAMGVRFDTWTNDERIHFRIQGGWEHHIYFSQNQFTHFVDNRSIGNIIGNQGDLTLQGWTLSARLDF